MNNICKGTLVRNLPSIVCNSFSNSTRFEYSDRTSTLSLVKVKHRTCLEDSGLCIAVTDVVLMYTSFIYIYIYIYIFFGGGGDSQGLLIHEVSRSHTTTHHIR